MFCFPLSCSVRIVKNGALPGFEATGRMLKRLKPQCNRWTSEKASDLAL